MTTSKKMKTGKAETARGAVHQERTTEKKNLRKENNAAKDVLPVTKSIRASSSNRAKQPGVVSVKSSDAEKAKAHSVHDAAKKNAQIEKNVAKLASHELHKQTGTKSHKGSGTAKTTVHKPESAKMRAKAHTLHDAAKKNAQVVKNIAKAASHELHKQPGRASHKVSDEEKAIALKAFSYEAKVEAHHPHNHAGEHTKASHEETGVHKTGKNGFVADLEEETRKNRDFRKVLYTGKNCQLVLMCLKPKEDIGMEVHGDVDQFFRFEEGEGSVEIDGTMHSVKDGCGVIVPCGVMHNVTNTSETELLKLYTIYAPPEHQDKVVRKTKREALSKEEHFDGKTTEKFSLLNVRSASVRSQKGADASLSSVTPGNARNKK
jgi:mannose-6-phosphate isomerase-like protein (cupin superfamily)